MERVVIFGTSEMGQMAYFYLTNDSPYQVAAFAADRDYISEEKLFGLPIAAFEDIEAAYPPQDYRMLVAISYTGWNSLRAEKYHEAKEKGYHLINYVSSKAIIGPESVVGDNCLIFQNSICEPFSRIGNNVVVRVGCSIGHHSVIKDHCFLASHAVVLGHATVEAYSFLGANSTIRNDTVVAERSIVGAGALIMEDTQERGVYKGGLPTLLPIPSDSLRSR